MKATYENVPVYYSQQDHRSQEPAFVVPREQARAWRNEGKGYFIDHGKALRFTPEYEEQIRAALHGGGPDAPVLKALRHDESCVMGERVMNSNADGELWARALVRCWNPRIARLEHARSLHRYRNLQPAGEIIRATS